MDPITLGIAAAGLATSIGGGLFGASKARKAARRERENLRQQRAASEAWYARNYHEDYLNSVEAQNALRRARDAWDDRMKAARGRQAVTGGTQEQILRAEEVGADAYGNMVGALAAQGAANKRAVDAQKLEIDKQQSLQESVIANAEQQAGQNLVSNSISAGVGALQVGAGAFDKTETATTTPTATESTATMAATTPASNPIADMDFGLKSSDFTKKIDEPFNPAGKAWWDVAEEYKNRVTY